MYQRYIAQNVKEALADTPVVFIMGPRQSGKTTLVKSLIDDRWEYITFDDQTQFLSAKADSVSFLRQLSSFEHVVLDEVQRVPEIFISLKQLVDEMRMPGRFLLTGSANAMLLPKLSDSLAGRMESIKLNPLSECEIRGSPPSFLDKLMREEIPVAQETGVKRHLLERITAGCFPEPVQRSSEKRRAVWYQQYVNSLIQRDIRDFANIDHPEMMTRLLKLTAFYAGRLVNFTELSSKLSLDRVTTKKYTVLLEQLFLLERLLPWHTNEYKRLVKTPKLHSVDTGLICAIRGFNKNKLAKQPTEFGLLLEAFVYNELRKQAAWLDQPLSFYHYRDKDKLEVDVVIENADGDCFAIEVKAAATLSPRDFTGLRRFQSIAAARFRLGILFYDGERTVTFGERLYAVPFAALWAD